MSPLLATRASASARGYGFTALSSPDFYLASYGTAGTGSDVPNALNADATGLISITGQTQGMTLKTSAAGTLLSSAKITGNSIVNVLQAAFDSSNNMYAATHDESGTKYAYLVKVNSSSVVQWGKSFNRGSGYDYIRDLTVDGSGNVYMCGVNDWDLSDHPAFTAKVDSTGSVLWQRWHFSAFTGGNVFPNFYAVNLDSSGNVYSTGQDRIAGVGWCAAVVKYNSSGTLQWKRHLYKSATDVLGYCSKVSATGNVYVTANVSSALLIAKYNSIGSLQWQRTLSSGAPSSSANSVALDADENVYVVQQSAGSLAFGVAKYNASGAIQWQRTFTYTSPVNAVFGASIYLSGNKMFILSAVSTPTTGYDVHLYCLPTDGSKTGTYTLNGLSITYAAGTGTDAAGSTTDAASTLTDVAGSTTVASATFSTGTVSMTTTLVGV